MRKVLIANRGEIACRVIRSCDALGLETVAVFSEADAESKHVAMAGESYPIGPPAAKESYLDMENLLAAAKATGADAVHPGYGFLAENAEFADAVERAGLTWIGPRADTIRAMGDKEQARQLAVRAGLPVVPGSRRFSDGETDGLVSEARVIGYPLLVKASAGGGGIGMKRIDDEEGLVEVATSTQNMASKSFGDGTIYLEKMLEKPRHIEIQVFGFGDGRAVHLFERECSIQRRYQKIVEESPSPGISVEARDAMANAAVALAESQNYTGAGTVEFIVAPDETFYFLEMNTRIQVEHPVTEMLTGVDLVEMQLRHARGESLDGVEQESILPDGHAIECRIYAENPGKNFLPAPGLLETYVPPAQEDGIRIDGGYRQGDRLTFYYDPMVAKLIVHGPDRPTAIEKMIDALERFQVTGLETNIEFLQRVFRHQSFRDGHTHTEFISEHSSMLLTES